MEKSTPTAASQATRLILLMGIVSLLADITYEGARSITGPYLAVLGANAAVVGLVAGFAEFIGYAVRFFSGYLADRAKSYWAFTLIGYAINLLAVPALALTGYWPYAAGLIVLERFGKALRVPARDAILSNASETIGMGVGFGLHEALDKIGGMTGPLVVAIVFLFENNYRNGFALLAIPALLALAVLFVAYRYSSNPRYLKIKQIELHPEGIPKLFWIYLIGVSFIAAGYADFALMAYHFQKTAILPQIWIPSVYAIAMGVNSLSAPLLGKFYDKKGFVTLIVVTLITSLFSPLVFFGNFVWAVVGVVLWSIGVCAQQTLMRAVVGNMINFNKRGSAYGIFNMGYGIAWFLGSVVMGMLYDHSITLVVIFILVMQFASFPWLIKVKTTIDRMGD